MNIRKFKSRLLKNYTIVNDSGWTRTGFYHESILLHYNREVNMNKSYLGMLSIPNKYAKCSI